MSFFVSKTFDIIKITSEPHYNFYTPDELYEENSIKYTAEQYKDILQYKFIRNEREADFSARYIKLAWEMPKESKILFGSNTTSTVDAMISDVIFNNTDVNSEQNMFEMMNMNSLTDQYYEYYCFMYYGFIVIGKEQLNNNELLTNERTKNVFWTFASGLNSKLEVKNTNRNEISKYYTNESTTGYCGFLIFKEEAIDNKYQLHSIIMIGGTYINTYFDYFVKYNTSYRYRICTIYRNIFPNNETEEITLGEDKIIQDNKYKGKNKKEFVVGNLSGYSENKVIDIEPPNYPEDIRVLPDLETNSKFILLWSHTEQPQKDTDHYIVYIRINKKTDSPQWLEWKIYDKNYIIIKLDQENEENFKNYGFIFAIGSVDKHGLKSNLSRQILIQYKQKGNKNIADIKTYKESNDPNNMVVLPIDYDNMKILKASSLINKIIIRPGANFDGKTYMMRLVSEIGDVSLVTINPSIKKMDTKETIKKSFNNIQIMDVTSMERVDTRNITKGLAGLMSGNTVGNTNEASLFTGNAEENKAGREEKKTTYNTGQPDFNNENNNKRGK